MHQANSVYSILVDVRRDDRNSTGKKRISVFETMLSKDPLNPDNVGYQEPIPPEVQPAKFNRNNGENRYGRYHQRGNWYQNGRRNGHNQHQPRYNNHYNGKNFSTSILLKFTFRWLSSKRKGLQRKWL